MLEFCKTGIFNPVFRAIFRSENSSDITRKKVIHLIMLVMHGPIIWENSAESAGGTQAPGKNY